MGSEYHAGMHVSDAWGGILYLVMFWPEEIRPVNATDSLLRRHLNRGECLARGDAMVCKV